MRIFALIFLLLILTAYSQREKRFRHIRNLLSINEGDNPNEVVQKYRQCQIKLSILILCIRTNNNCMT